MIFSFLAFLFLISCTEAQEVSEQSKRSVFFNKFISEVELPEHLNFCGEKVPIEIPEVHERAERELLLLLQQPGQIVLYLKRSGRYFPMFEKKLEENDLPDDLKFISVAESALYMSRSNKGAVGLWQFMPSTARAFGLQVDNYVDERRHPERSTDAAIEYLKEGFDFNRSWHLTAAGYNMGHGRVSENLTYQFANDFYDLYLNEETSRYLLRIVIIKEIMSNPSRYGFDINKIELYKPFQVQSIEARSSIKNLSDWARNFGTTYKDVKLLNPWILKRKLPRPSSGKYEIYIPLDN